MNYISGGLLGDLLNVLYVIKSKYIETGIKGNLYITDDPKFGGEKFNTGVVKTYLDTYNLITNQEYINQYKIYDPSLIDSKTIINLSSWRQSQFLYKKNWIEIFTIKYDLKNISYPWIQWNKYNNKYQNKILVHRSSDIRRHTNYFPWNTILANNNNSITKYTFITCNRKEYDNFPSKHLVDLEVFDVLEDLYTAINSCQFFIGNQSMPLAFAIAIGKPCLAELCATDYMHYAGIEKYNKEFLWKTPYVNPYVNPN